MQEIKVFCDMCRKELPMETLQLTNHKLELQSNDLEGGIVKQKFASLDLCKFCIEAIIKNLKDSGIRAIHSRKGRVEDGQIIPIDEEDDRGERSGN